MLRSNLVFGPVLTIVSLLALNSLAFAETIAKKGPAFAQASGCDLMDSTPETQSTLEWDRQQANIDLMVAEMRKGGYNPKAVKVAVIDGAFDDSARKMINGEVTVDGGPIKPKNGHATSVIGRITQASPGTVIKNYPLMENAAASPDQVLKVATKACNEGYQVINLSLYFPGGAVLASQQMVRAALAARGCMLVQASGNSNATAEQRKATERDIKADAFRSVDIITVGASDINGGRGKFSTPAIVRAPGVDVPIVDPERLKPTESGTSFSAPTVSAIVKNILTILKSSPKTARLSPIDQVPLTTAIVKACAVKDIVDGYRAVVIAKAVAAKGAEAMLKDGKSRDEFVHAAFADAESSLPQTTAGCRYLQDCADKKSCYQNKRKLYALNPSKFTTEDLEDLADTTSGSADPHLSQQWNNARQKALTSKAGTTR